MGKLYEFKNKTFGKVKLCLNFMTCGNWSLLWLTALLILDGSMKVSQNIEILLEKHG